MRTERGVQTSCVLLSQPPCPHPDTRRESPRAPRPAWRCPLPPSKSNPGTNPQPGLRLGSKKEAGRGDAASCLAARGRTRGAGLQPSPLAHSCSHPNFCPPHFLLPSPGQFCWMFRREKEPKIRGVAGGIQGWEGQEEALGTARENTVKTALLARKLPFFFSSYFFCSASQHGGGDGASSEPVLKRSGPGE